MQKPLYNDSPKILANVYLEISIEREPYGRIEIELFADVPKTAENFLALCTGEANGYSFQGNRIHKVFQRQYLEAGDVLDGTGSGEPVSLYDGFFEDENFIHKHKKGYLSMSNEGPNTNNSKFCILFRDIPERDGKYVVFGRVKDRKSLEVLEEIDNRCGTVSGNPYKLAKIFECDKLR